MTGQASGDLILAHDLGTTGNKATLVSADARLLAAVTVDYGVDFGPGGKAEQDPEDWWGAFCAANRLLLARAGVDSARIACVSFSGQMMGAVPVDQGGRPVRPAIIWADTRARRQTEELVGRLGMSTAYEITGHRLNPTYSLEKIMWLRDNEPESYAKTGTFLLAKDFIVCRLTGERVTDPSDASGTNAFDQQTGRWSEELLEAAEVSPDRLPEVVPSTTVVGGVLPSIAEEAGLRARTPVVVGGGDGPLAALGAGILGEDSGAYAYLGSSSWVSIASDRPLHDPAMRSMTFNHVIPGRFVPTATMQAGGASLQWVVDLLQPSGVTRFADLLDAAGRGRGADGGLFFLPHLLGERSPYWNPRARGAFVGLQMHHTRGDMVRAVLEGVAFNLRTGLTAFTESGRTVPAIDAIGGAATSDVFLSLAADIWGVPVSSRNLVDEANAIGAAVVGGVGVGVFSDFQVVERFSTRTTTREPHPDLAAGTQRHWEQFLDAYERMEPWFTTLDDDRQ